MNRIFPLSFPLCLCAALGLSSCSDDDASPSGGDASRPALSEMSFIVCSSDPSADLTGGIAMKVYTDLSTPRTGQQVYGAADALKCPDCFTQVTYNPRSRIFTGYIYARGASADGIGSMQAGLRSYAFADGTLSEIAEPVKVAVFGNTGTFGTFSYAAQTSQPYTMVVDAAGTGRNIALELPQYAIDEVNPAVSNIVDMGDGTVAMVLNYSNRDTAAVAFCDYDLHIRSIAFDARIGTSLGSLRSVRYAQSGTDDEGNVYVFSGASASDVRVGALCIPKGSTCFCDDYHFDILAASGGYRFRKAFHISDDKFLLEFYNDPEHYGNMDASGRMAVVDMSEKSLRWVSGLPDPSTVSIGWGDGYDGYYYLPIAAPTDMSGSSSEASAPVQPAIWRIDAATGQAEPFMTFAETDLLKAVTIIKP